MTLDFVSHMTHLAAPSDLSTYPYAVAALDTPLNGAAAADKGVGKKDTSDLAPFAPAEASIFPRFVRPRSLSLSLTLPLALSPSRALALTLLRHAVVPGHQPPHLALRLPLPPPPAPPVVARSVPFHLDLAGFARTARQGALRQGQLGGHVAQRLLRRSAACTSCSRAPARDGGARRARRDRAVDPGKASRAEQEGPGRRAAVDELVADTRRAYCHLQLGSGSLSILSVAPEREPREESRARGMYWH